MANKSTKPLHQRTGITYGAVLKLSRYLKLSTIVYLPVVLSGIVFLIGSIIAIQVYPNGTPLSFTGILLFIIFILASFSGFIQIAIQEIPGMPISIQGKAAKLFGISWVVTFWFIAICAIWYFH